MLGGSNGWMLRQSTGLRTRPWWQFGMWRSRTARRMCRGRSWCGETTWGINRPETSAARKWSGDSTRTSWQGLSRAGLPGIKTSSLKCACMFWQKSLLSRRLSASTTTRWNLSCLTWDANALTNCASMSRLGKSQTSTINSCSLPIWLFLALKRIAINLCSKRASMPWEITRKRRNSAWCRRPSKVTAHLRLRAWTSKLSKKLNKLWGQAVTEALTPSRIWSTAKWPNTSTSGKEYSNDKVSW